MYGEADQGAIGVSVCRNCYYSDKEGRGPPVRALRARNRRPRRPPYASLRPAVRTRLLGRLSRPRPPLGLLTGCGRAKPPQAGSPRAAHPARPDSGRRNWRELRRALPCPGLLGWPPPQPPTYSMLCPASLPFAARTSVKIAVRIASGSVAQVWAISSSSGLSFPEFWEAIEEGALSAPLAGASPSIVSGLPRWGFESSPPSFAPAELRLARRAQRRRAAHSRPRCSHVIPSPLYPLTGCQKTAPA